MSTGNSAIVTLHTAMAHLHHFCAKLTPEPYVDNRPIFAFEELDSAQAGKFIRAKVTLPASIDALLRITEGRSSWATEKAARKDAAFEAYVKLYRAGLVNDHLLPLRMDRESPYPMAKNTDSILEVCEQKNPWTGLGITGDVNGVDCNWRPLRMTNLETDEVLELRLCTSSEAEIRGVSTVLHWDRSVRYKIEICEESKKCLLSPEHLEELRQTTDLYLRFTHPATPASADSSLPILLSPAIEPEQLGPWLLENSGFRTLDEVVPMRAHRDEDRQVLRHRGGKMGYLTEAVKNEDGSFLVKYILIPKRRDFSVDPAAGGGSTFNDKEEEAASSLQREATIDADEAHRYSIDKLTPSHTRFASLVPTILHTLTHTLLATNLSRTTLAPLNLRNSYPIRQALTSSSAGSSSNYQRLEFLGDSLLKSLTATSLYQTHPSWPESYLSLAKDGLVSNARLTRAALSIGLDAYIITRGFAAQKWRFAELLQDRTDESRMVSAKVLADVVEALIGGAFLEGGLAGAGACVRLFLPELPAAPPPPFPRSMTLPSDSSGLQSAAPTRLLQKLTGYTFKHPGLLLEALTHPSQSLDTQTSSYQRLEFLGDALLDEIVVRKLYEFPEALTHGYLHLAKTAVVNGGFLAYANLALTMVETIPRVEVRSGTRRRDKEVIEGVAEKSIGLWALMRHSNPEIIPAQQEVLERFTTHGPKIRALLDSGQRYPWVELAALDAPKFLSDLVEGLLGAVYMDSNGDMGACEALVERFGVFRVLERAKKGGGVMRLMHPKEELGVLAGEREVRYEGGVKADVAGGGGEGWYWAEVRVGGKRMAGVQGVRGRAEAETRVAALAGDVLRRERQEECKVGEAEGLGLEVVG